MIKSKLLHKAYLACMRKLNPKTIYSTEDKINLIVESLADGLFNDKFQDKKHTPQEIAMICERLKSVCREKLINHANKCNAEMDIKYYEMQTALNVAFQLT